MDRLTPLLTHFRLHAGVFYTGNICGIHSFQPESNTGHLHLVRRGPVQFLGLKDSALEITAPSLLLIPRSGAHQLVADEQAGADVVCGTIKFGAGGQNPLIDSLPGFLLVELAALPGVEALLEMMFDEAFADESGRQGIVDRLCEVLVIRLLRFGIGNGLTRGGTLAGLSDSRLAKVLSSIHDAPGEDWDLVRMAEVAGMSRARFALRFKEVTGETPADYLAAWRLLTAQRLLRSGQALKHVAYDVGYGSPSALARVFARKLGVTPTEWIKSVEP